MNTVYGECHTSLSVKDSVYLEKKASALSNLYESLFVRSLTKSSQFFCDNQYLSRFEFELPRCTRYNII